MTANPKLYISQRFAQTLSSNLDSFLKNMESLLGAEVIDRSEKVDLESLQDGDLYLEDLQASLLSVANYPVLPTSVRLAGAFDLISRRSGKLIPRLVFDEAIKSLLVKRAKNLDIGKPAIIVGGGGQMRAAISALSSLGYKEIILVNDDDSVLDIKKEVMQKFMGIRFRVMQIGDLTSGAIKSSLVINFIEIQEGSETFTNLAYFNYLQEAGWVVDLTENTSDNLLFEEAIRADLHALNFKMFLEYYCDQINREFVNQT